MQIITESRGVKYHDLVLKHQDSVLAFIPKETLPEGVIKFTVLNTNNQVLGERLFFNTKTNDRLKLDIAMDKSIYRQREKTILKISLDGMQRSKQASLSVLVMDKEKIKSSNQFKPSLLSYFLLNSE